MSEQEKPFEVIDEPREVIDAVIVEETIEEESPSEHEWVGASDYKNVQDVVWFTMGNKSFPTKMVNSWIIMRLAKAQNDENQTRALAATYDLLEKLIPKRYRGQFDHHMSEIEYEEEELNAQIELVMTKWANRDKHSVAPLVQKKQSAGSDTPQSESPTFREVSLSTGEVKERPLTEEEMEQYKAQMETISTEELEKMSGR